MSIHALRLLPLVLLMLMPVGMACAQEQAAEDRFDLDGFLKVDAFYDSRQTVSAREGELLLYPLPTDHQVRETGSGLVDVNDRSYFNIASFYSRLRLGVTGPAVLGGESEGVVESDFIGTTDGLENTLRLRHAFVRVRWEAAQVVFGQYWSPLFVPDVFPRTVSFNLGVPTQPLARFPQARVTLTPGRRFAVVGAISAQRDAFQDIAGRQTQQQSGIPGAHLHVQHRGDVLFAGVGAYLRTVRPSLNGRRMTSGAASVYTRFRAGRWTLRSQALYGTNMADHLMLGGYVQTRRDPPAVGAPMRRYANLQTLAAWTDASVSVGTVTVGLFGGYTTNLGATRDIRPDAAVTFQARGNDLAYVWRVSPRLAYNIDNLRFAVEIESTTAFYSTERAANLRPGRTSGDRVSNLRGLVSAFLFF